MWTSVPQIVVSVTRISASPGPGRGRATSSTRMSSGAWNTAARMVVVATSTGVVSFVSTIVIPSFRGSRDERGRWSFLLIVGARAAAISAERPTSTCQRAPLGVRPDGGCGLRVEVEAPQSQVAQLFAEVRVGDGDECMGTLPHAAPEQLGNPILGDDSPHMRPAGDHAGTLGQHRADPRDRAPGGRRRQRDDGAPPGASAAPRMKSTWPPTPE